MDARPRNPAGGSRANPAGEKSMRDFADSARRHFDDAELLLEGARLAGADHLFGLSAECAIKASLVALGAKTDGLGDIDRPGHAVHVNRLWKLLPNIPEAQGRQGAALQSLIKIDPFSDWHVNQRYDHRRYATPERLAGHRNGALRAFEALERCEPNFTRRNPS